MVEPMEGMGPGPRQGKAIKYSDDKGVRYNSKEAFESTPERVKCAAGAALSLLDSLYEKGAVGVRVDRGGGRELCNFCLSRKS